MKSIPEQISEVREALLAFGQGHVTPEQLKEAVKDCINEEHRLSVLKALAKKHNVKPVAEAAKIKRNNGSGSVEITESDKNAERVQAYMKKARCSFREASIIVLGVDPGNAAKEPNTVVVERAARWKKFGGLLTEQECQRLAEKGIEP